MAYIQKRGNKWFCQVRRKGYPAISKTFKERQDAEDFAKKLEDEIEKEKEAFSTRPLTYDRTLTGLDLQLMYRKSRQRAALANIEHSISEIEFMELYNNCNGVCSLSGVRFSAKKRPSWRIRPYFPSLDRIDSEKGYTKDNVRFVLASVNVALSDWGDDVLKEISFGIVSRSIMPHIAG